MKLCRKGLHDLDAAGGRVVRNERSLGCRLCRNEWKRVDRAANPDKTRGVNMRHLYGKDIEVEYERLLQVQGRVCAVCLQADHTVRPLNVDHDHTTGRVRGLLCSKCNTALGLLDENIDHIHALAGYLQGVEQLCV